MLKVINKTPDIVTIEQEGKDIILRLGDIERRKLKDIYFDLELENHYLNFLNIEAGCRACTKVFTKRLSDNKVEVRVNINWKNLHSMFNKRIVFTYKVDGKTFKKTIIVNGRII